MAVNFRAVSQRINIRVAGLQIAVNADATVDGQPGTARQRGFRAQAGRGDDRIHLYLTIAIQRGANTGSGFLQTLQLRFQQQMYAHIGQTMLQAAAHFRRHQRGQNAGGIVNQRDGFTRTAEIHCQLATNQTAADDQYALRVTQLRFAGAILLLAVQCEH